MIKWNLSPRAATVCRKISLFLKILKFHKNEDLNERNNFHTCHEVQKWTEDCQFCPQSRLVPKTSPTSISSSTVVQRGQGWLGFSPGMMGYKAQVVASAIALPIRQKIENSGRSIIDFCRLSWPQIATYRG